LFLHNFSFLMFFASAAFCFLIGQLFQRRVDQEQEAREIEAYLRDKKAKKSA
jgi:hypothetical protein